jgi:hypothetical protein
MFLSQIFNNDHEFFLVYSCGIRIRSCPLAGWQQKRPPERALPFPKAAEV